MYDLQQTVSTQEIIDSLDMPVTVSGSTDRQASAFAPVNQATDNAVTFCSYTGDKALAAIENSDAGIIICSDTLTVPDTLAANKTLLLVSNPRLAYCRMLNTYGVAKTEAVISKDAVIEETAIIHKNVSIGPHCYIGECEIGENTVIKGNVFIDSNTVIGKNVLIHSGVVIGPDGQGFERNDKNELEKFPQFGGVKIGDNVEIGSNSSVMRGAMGDTVIGDGTKIGHLCTVGHGAIIGRHCLLITQSVIGGSCVIEDYAQISLGSLLRNGLTIGSHATVGMGSVVTKNVAEGKTVLGVPAREINA